ncbi:MAG TPA: glycerophosphodiester phosphodiesterase [Acidimicrobiales bacterium]
MILRGESRTQRGPGRPLVLAHRGVRAGALENTVAAFEAADGAGADGVELDVRRTADGALVVVHDPLLGDGRIICETMSGDLPTSVPSLSEAIAACSGVVDVEAKDLPHEPGFDPHRLTAVDAARVLVELDEADRCWISSFHPDALAAIRSNVEAVRTGLLMLHIADARAEVAAAVASCHVALHPHDPLVTAELVDLAHGVGLDVYAWTVDDPDRVGELATFGVDGIISDDPAAVRAALDRPDA